MYREAKCLSNWISNISINKISGTYLSINIIRVCLRYQCFYNALIATIPQIPRQSIKIISRGCIFLLTFIYLNRQHVLSIILQGPTIVPRCLFLICYISTPPFMGFFWLEFLIGFVYVYWNSCSKEWHCILSFSLTICSYP